MNPPRSPMLQRCSSSPGIAATSASVNPGTSAEEMPSYEPTRMSSRVTGRRDQKFAPRVAWSEVIRSSTVASGRVIQSGVMVAGKMIQLREHCRNLVGQDEHEVVVLHLAHGMCETFSLVVDDLDLTVGHSRLVQPLDDEAGHLARLASAAVLVLADDHAVELRREPADGSQVLVAPVAGRSDYSNSPGSVEVVDEFHQSGNRRRVVSVVQIGRASC